VVVIGAGTRRFIPPAIRAGQKQLTVACVDEWKNSDGSAAFGGTCLNAGCIPSKALLESSEAVPARPRMKFAVHGIVVGTSSSISAADAGKRRALGSSKTMTNGIMALFRANGVDRHSRSWAPAAGANRVLVTGAGRLRRTLQARHVVLASGSVARFAPAYRAA